MDGCIGRAARCARPTFRGMDLLWNPRNARLLLSARAPAQPVFSTRTSPLPDAFASILLGDAHPLATACFYTVQRERHRGTCHGAVLLASPCAAGGEIRRSLDRHRARIA